MMGLIDHPLTPLIVEWHSAETLVSWGIATGKTHKTLIEARDALNVALGKDQSPWQPIVTAPKMKNILLFAVTDIGEDGEVRNWKMDSGYWSSGAECWTWSGYQVRKYDIQPTHWQPMPAAPARDLLNAALEDLK